jgi:hypothetical protein
MMLIEFLRDNDKTVPQVKDICRIPADIYYEQLNCGFASTDNISSIECA